MAEPYYQDDLVTLYHGDCREITCWRETDALVTDPPYGITWRGHSETAAATGVRDQIIGDDDTSTRDSALALWDMNEKPAVVFGSSLLAPPLGTKQVLVWRKPADSGLMGSIAGFRRDWEAIYLMGKWPKSARGPRSGVLETFGTMRDYMRGHPHGKPVTVLQSLVSATPRRASIADPFAGSGSTLIAARNQGRRCIGVEIDERYCEVAAERLAQQAFDFEGLAS